MMGVKEEQGSVDLAAGKSATAHLHRALAATHEMFPSVFGEVDIGSGPDEFKRRYPEILPVFEAARADAPERADIAAALVAAGRSAIVMRANGEEIPLRDHVTEETEPMALASADLRGESRLQPRLPLHGRLLAGDELVEATRAIVERGSASPQVADAVASIVEQAGSEGIDLRGHRIVMLGAGAELAPTRLWLEGGADVLWIDVTDPPADLVDSDELSGSLQWVAGGVDLLARPEAIRATIEAFAGDDEVDVGLYAYAPGQAREWRLAAAMNAIVDAIPHDMVRGVALLVSPTTCGVLTADDLAGEERRRRERPRWHAVLDRFGLFGRGAGHARHGETCTNRGIVSIQGGSYQAAQYLGKLMAAEAWATGDPARRVSANTAGITLTESLHHPVFDTAFSGAGALAIETFDPATTAYLNGMLTLSDRLALEDPGGADPNELFACRVHGGIYEFPHAIEPALRVATALGVVKNPLRIAALLRGS